MGIPTMATRLDTNLCLLSFCCCFNEYSRIYSRLNYLLELEEESPGMQELSQNLDKKTGDAMRAVLHNAAVLANTLKIAEAQEAILEKSLETLRKAKERAGIKMAQ